MIYQWVTVIAIVIISLFSIYKKKPDLMVIVLNLVVFRCYTPFLDLDDRRFVYSSG